MASHYPAPNSFHHKRAKSSVLSFMHKRTPSEGIALPLPLPLSPNPAFISTPIYEQNTAFLPQDHLHSRALAERQNHQSPPQSSPKKSKEGKRPTSSDDIPIKPLHKKTLSSISLKTLAGKGDTEKSLVKEEKVKKPKKNKSSRNLASLLSRPKSSQSLHKQTAEEQTRNPKDKENQRPGHSSPTDPPTRPPIYAQFSSELFAKQPLGGKFLEDQIDLYTPENYSPGKQRNFYYEDGRQPSLTRRDEPQRPKSTYLPSSFSIQDISRRVSGSSSRHSADLIRRVSGDRKPSLERKSTDTSVKSGKHLNFEKRLTESSTKSDKTTLTRGSRVLAAVTGFGSKPKSPESSQEQILDDKNIDKEFEAMLDRRNIPEHQRGKMRNLALSMKKDFVKQDWAEVAAAKNGRPGTNGSDSSADVTAGTPEIVVKKTRPRSRTFTLSRGTSKESKETTPASKKKEGTFGRHARQKSTDSIGNGKLSLTSAGASVAQTLIAKAKGQTPDDFVSYLRKVQKPELVEVGRLHKLRLLLRNETVAWTDGFIGQGGMEEIVGLLHRTMEVEWREEHEDALLHEVLLCLKALSTTALALEHLNKIQITLFPALLHMLFDEEKKGPSEFTTRNIITSLLFTYLKSAPLSERAPRARTLLQYFRDPEPSESQRPVDFVLDMRRLRPYRVWSKEVVNVTKEVFWIFLHNLNVIALPGTRGAEQYMDRNDGTVSSLSSATSSSSFEADNPHHIYMVKHFPPELPPVPAAPYVGGVEWDATNYLASHLDILNGCLACLPSREERNGLRDQLRVSGWERCMGGTLRLCKEKFYGGVHAGLRCWVAAAAEDGWDTRDVRCGPRTDAQSPTRKIPKKNVVEQPAPKLDLKLDFGKEVKKSDDDAWL